MTGRGLLDISCYKDRVYGYPFQERFDKGREGGKEKGMEGGREGGIEQTLILVNI